MGLSIAVRWIQRLIENRNFKKAERFTEDTATGFWALYHLALTYHGRVQLSRAIANADELEIDPRIVGLYRIVLEIAPYKVYATIN